MLKMSIKDRGSYPSPGTVLSVLCLLLYSVGFVRIELKFNDRDQRLEAMEEVVAQMKHGIAKGESNEDFPKEKQNAGLLHQRLPRSASSKSSSSNKTACIRGLLEDIINTCFKICERKGKREFCSVGRPGPPGSAGPKGDKGGRGRVGKKGSRGMMGQPGRSGKQGIMGPPGIRGVKGNKGDVGAPGIPGIKGEPGESISVPNVVISPSLLTVNETNNAMLFCSDSGNPAAHISWLKLNGSLPNNRVKVTGDGVIQINGVRAEDAGIYKCVASNLLGSDEKVAKVVVQTSPKISLRTGPSYVAVGKTVMLPKCNVASLPAAEIIWTKISVPDTHPRMSVGSDGQLSITNAHRKDSGFYQCRATNKIGVASALTHLVVVDTPVFTARPPSHLRVKYGQTVSILCEANGDPSPKITWLKENGVLPPGRSAVSIAGTLNLWQVKPQDSGKYTCVATSAGVSTTSTSVQFTVLTAGALACHPVGIGDTNKIPDSNMPSSSHYLRYHAYYGRLNGTRGGGGWCSRTKTDRTDFLQVDMGKEYTLCAVATQGKRSGSYVTSYKLHLSTDGVRWNTYQEDTKDKILQANTDRNNVVKYSLTSPSRARFVRFYPVTHSNHPCMRVEVFALQMN